MKIALFNRLVKTLLCLFIFLSFSSLTHAATTIRDFNLSPSAPYVDTDIDILIGDSITIRQVGSLTIQVPGMSVPWLSPHDDANCVAGPLFTLPGVNCWSLVAKVGIGSPFFVGLDKSLISVTNGRLYLGINHQLPLTGSGSWSIRVIKNFTPPPPPPQPFLQLPWNSVQGKSFSESILHINSYFDHEYPLLSSGLNEPSYIMSFDGLKIPERFYSSHDGYDWGRLAGATLDMPVLAAADGCAFYRYTGGLYGNHAGGNEIHINHTANHSHYQTRYYHLNDDAEPPGTAEDDFITKETDPENCVSVSQGDPIGKVGSTGNSTGAHLHFMVVEDKNRDGDFDDNIPDGITDPFGWQSILFTDPWPDYQFTYNGQARTGAKSFYLWQEAIPNLHQDLTTNGGFFIFQNTKVSFGQNGVKEKSTLSIAPLPFVKISDLLESVGNSFEITVRNLFGTVINEFEQAFTVTFDYSDLDLTRFKPETMAIYSSTDGNNWTREESTIDETTQTVYAPMTHLTQFALIAERKDSTPPVTAAAFSKPSVGSGKYPAPLSISLASQDNINGLGVDYTMFQINDGSWQSYETPLELSDSGFYTISFYSVDEDENIEETKVESFELVNDITSPEVLFVFDPLLQDIVLSPIDDSPTTASAILLPKNQELHTFEDINGNKTTLLVIDRERGLSSRLRIKNITYSDEAIHTFPPNRMMVNFSEDGATKTTKAIIQFFSIEPDLNVRMAYRPKNDNTIVIVKDKGKEKIEETIPGRKLLKVTTDHGTLKYDY